MKAILRRPEIITLLLLLIAFGISAVTAPSILSLSYLLQASSIEMETGIMALAMTFIIISGNIDLSVAAGLALIAVCSARLFEAGVPMQWVMALAILMGIILGLFNGLLITKLGLPSLTVTLGTLALYRGLAQRLLGDRSIGKFPAWFVRADKVTAFGLIPAPLIIFLLLALILGIILHKTIFGRCVYAIGTNEPAARFSGLQVDRIKISIYVLSGLTMAIGALLMMSRLSVARYDHANGYELSVITAVVLGGTDIFGGRGSIIGTVLALTLLMIVQQGMILQGISAETQLTVTGSLLVVSVILANLTGKLSTRRPAPKRPAANPTGGDLKHA